MHPTRSSLQLLPAGTGFIEGWRTGSACPDCGTEAVYYLDYDATCCLACNCWIALHCPDPDCAPCRCRPAVPVAAPVQRLRPTG